MAGIPGRTDKRWRDLCKKLKRELPPVCWICGEDIDLELSGRDPMGWSLDHVRPIHEEPHLMYEESNLRPAHMIHNATRGGKQQKISGSKSWG